jgi:hypothetical protein
MINDIEAVAVKVRREVLFRHRQAYGIADSWM